MSGKYRELAGLLQTLTVAVWGFSLLSLLGVGTACYLVISSPDPPVLTWQVSLTGVFCLWMIVLFHVLALSTIQVFEALKDTALHTKQSAENMSRLIGTMQPHLEYYSEAVKWMMDER